MEGRSARVGRSGPPTQFNASFDERPRDYDDLRASGHMAHRRAEFFTAVVDRCPGPVLEVGCGTGTLLRRLAAARPRRTFVGVEPLPAYVDFARARAGEDGLGNVRFEKGTGETLQHTVPDGWAGLVISVDALHHVRDTERVLTQVHRVTAPRAHWWAMEPNRVHPYVLAYHVLTPGERTFPVRDFLRQARANGWEPRGRESLFTYPSGVKSVPAWAGRLERRIERFRPIAGAVVLDLARTDPVSAARGR